MWKILGLLPLCLSVVLSAVVPNLMNRDARGVVGAYASPALKVLSSGTPVGPSGLGQVVRSAYATQPLSYQQDQPSRGGVYQQLQGAYAQQQLQVESPLKNYRGGDGIQQAVELQVPETIVGKDVPEGGALPPAYAQAAYEESPYAQISGGGGSGGQSPYTLAQVASLSPYSQVGGGSPSLYSRGPSPYAQLGGSPFSQAGGQVLSSSPYAQSGPYSPELAEGPSPYSQSGVEAAPQGGGGSSRGPPLEFRGVYPGLSGPPPHGGLSGPFGFGPSGVSHSPRPSPYLFNQPVHTLGLKSQSHQGVTKGVPSKTTKATQSSASVEGGDVPIIMYGGGGPGGPDGRYNIEELEAGGPSPQGIRGPPSVYNLQGLGGGPEEFSPYSGGPISYSLGGGGPGGPGGPPPQHFAYSPESGPPSQHSSPFSGGPPRGPTFLQEVSSPSAAEYVAKPRRQRHPSFDFSPMQLLRRPRHGYMQGGPRGPPQPPSHEFDY